MLSILSSCVGNCASLFDFLINNIYIRFGNSSELKLKDTTLTSNEVCYLDTRIKNGDSNAHFHLSVYDKRDYSSFWIVNFAYIKSNMPANPAYGVYISQLVRYARICTSKLEFIHTCRLRQLSTHLFHQGFKSTNHSLNSSNDTVLSLRSMVLPYGGRD